MANTCLIPCFNRPELLHHALRCIEAANPEGIHFLFRPDRGASPENLEVISTFKFPYTILPEPIKARYAGIMKQSWSVLTGYGEAVKLAGDGLVYYIEDDVMVAPEFFEWHRLGHEQGRGLFCSIASEDTNTPEDKRSEQNSIGIIDERLEYPEATIWKARVSDGTYRSIGVCWTAENLRKFVQPHVNPSYFLNPWMYLKQTFPNSPWKGSWCEQDGLIRRIQLESGLPIAYPFEPLCYHAGYYGTNRGNPNKPKGTLQQRIEEVGNVIYSDEKMRAVNKRNPMFYDDSKPIPCLTSAPTPQRS